MLAKLFFFLPRGAANVPYLGRASLSRAPWFAEDFEKDSRIVPEAGFAVPMQQEVICLTHLSSHFSPFGSRWLLVVVGTCTICSLLSFQLDRARWLEDAAGMQLLQPIWGHLLAPLGKYNMQFYPVMLLLLLLLCYTLQCSTCFPFLKREEGIGIDV